MLKHPKTEGENMVHSNLLKRKEGADAARMSFGAE